MFPMTTKPKESSSTLPPEIETGLAEYNAYAASQAEFEAPVASISIDESDESTEVHIDNEYKGINYHFRSIKAKDANDFYYYLNSQPQVRRKYADTKTVSLDATKTRVATFVNRYNRKNNTDGCYLLSGFVVSDNDTDSFLGIANLGASGKDGCAEAAWLNRVDAWSGATPEIVKEYAIDDKLRLTKHYSGVATVEACTLLQYSQHLKQEGHTLKGKALTSVAATARMDNPGSWKACAKAGMEVTSIDSNPSYGPELRYQLLFKLRP